MGKKRITQLLDQLKENQQADLQNAAAIYTVAQVAVTKLTEQTLEAPPQVALSASSAPPVLAGAPALLTQAELKARYGSHQQCRQAAKRAGITFPKTPSWAQLAAAMSYAPELQAVVDNYLNDHPSADLSGFTLTLRVDRSKSS